MNEENDVRRTGTVALAAEPEINPYTADAQERINRARAVLEGFPKTLALPPLTGGALSSAKRITAGALAQAARFAEEQPNIGGDLADVAKLRDGANFLTAYEGLREQAFYLLRDIDELLVQCKLETAKYARGLYRMARTYAASAPKASKVHAQVEVMRPVFGNPPRRSKPAPPADAEAVKK
jgi:hypothetical protein